MVSSYVNPNLYYSFETASGQILGYFKSHVDGEPNSAVEFTLIFMMLVFFGSLFWFLHKGFSIISRSRHAQEE